MAYVDRIPFPLLAELNGLLRKGGYGKGVGQFTESADVLQAAYSLPEARRLNALAAQVGLRVIWRQPAPAVVPVQTDTRTPAGELLQAQPALPMQSGFRGLLISEYTLSKSLGMKVVGLEQAVSCLKMSAMWVENDPSYGVVPYSEEVLAEFRGRAILVWRPGLSLQRMVNIMAGKIPSEHRRPISLNEWEGQAVPAGWRLIMREPYVSRNSGASYRSLCDEFHRSDGVEPPLQVTDLSSAAYAAIAWHSKAGDMIFGGSSGWSFCRNERKFPDALAGVRTQFRAAIRPFAVGRSDIGVMIDYAEVDDAFADVGERVGLALEVKPLAVGQGGQ